MDFIFNHWMSLMLSILQNIGQDGLNCLTFVPHDLKPVFQLEEWEYSLTVAYLINWSRGLSNQLNLVESIICTH